MKMVYRILVVLFVSVAASQAQQTGMSGVVSDVQGGVIQGAKVEVKKVDGSSFSATTNAQGVYLIPSLTAADYTITVNSPGFATVKTSRSTVATTLRYRR